MRIDTSHKWQMLILAAIFDMMGFVPKIFTVVATAGALAVGWIPFFGQAVGLAAIGAGTALNLMFTWLFMLIGYSWMWGWLVSRDVPVFGGHKLEKKALILPLTVLADMMPLVGTLLPGITLWTYTQIRFAQEEDRERHKRAVERAKEELRRYTIYMRRRAEQEAYMFEQAMVASVANDNQRTVGEAAHENQSRRSTAPLSNTSAQSPYVAARAA
jgi:hypothetical protein